MQSSLTIKIVIIFLLTIFLWVILAMMDGLVDDRMRLKDKVVRDIEESSAYAQTIMGPLLIVPYKKKVISWTQDGKTKEYSKVEYTKDGALYFLPEVFSLNGNLTIDKRYRGIYEAMLYNTDSQITGHFSIPKDFGVVDDLESYQFGDPILSIGVSDIRGINNNLKITFNKKDQSVNPGTNSNIIESGIHTVLTLNELQSGGDFQYAVHLKLQGSTHLMVVPIGRKTEVALSGNWPHPSFSGKFLPVTREVTKTGFTATWETNFFASDIESRINGYVRKNTCCSFEGYSNSTFGVSLVDPVNHYLKTDRAIKYGLLFICITFVSFFLFEVIKRLPIHPIQYGFVGVALALFFLLLLSLSEHIGFVLAYLCSSVACIALIGIYVIGILKSKAQGFGFIVLLTSIYGVLYVLLNAEDYSLLMGSIFVFGLLTVAMMLTRKLDWYKVTNLTAKSKEEV